MTIATTKHRTPHPPQARASKHVENSTDATRGEPLAARAIKRKEELDKALAKLSINELRERNDIEMALAALAPMMTGDVDHMSNATAASLNRWLESTKHLAELAPKPRGSR